MPGKMRECDGCHKIMRCDNLKNHMRKCKELRNKKDNEGDASGVNVKDSQTSTEAETRPKKHKADCLQESKDIPTTFKEEPGFSGAKSLTNETLLRMMEMMKITYENRARILKLEKRFHSKKRNTQAAILSATTLTIKQPKIDVNHLIDGSGIFLD